MFEIQNSEGPAKIEENRSIQETDDRFLVLYPQFLFYEKQLNLIFMRHTFGLVMQLVKKFEKEYLNDLAEVKSSQLWELVIMPDLNGTLHRKWVLAPK